MGAEHVLQLTQPNSVECYHPLNSSSGGAAYFTVPQMLFQKQTYPPASGSHLKVDKLEDGMGILEERGVSHSMSNLPQKPSSLERTSQYDLYMPLWTEETHWQSRKILKWKYFPLPLSSLNMSTKNELTSINIICCPINWISFFIKGKVFNQLIESANQLKDTTIVKIQAKFHTLTINIPSLQKKF